MGTIVKVNPELVAKTLDESGRRGFPGRSSGADADAKEGSADGGDEAGRGGPAEAVSGCGGSIVRPFNHQVKFMTELLHLHMRPRVEPYVAGRLKAVVVNGYRVVDENCHAFSLRKV